MFFSVKILLYFTVGIVFILSLIVSFRYFWGATQNHFCSNRIFWEKKKQYIYIYTHKNPANHDVPRCRTRLATWRKTCRHGGGYKNVENAHFVASVIRFTDKNPKQSFEFRRRRTTSEPGILRFVSFFFFFFTK